MSQELIFPDSSFIIHNSSFRGGNMSEDSFKALVVNQTEAGPQATIQELQLDSLPAGDVLVSVAYSSLNYKDGLAVTGKGKVIRQYPMVPGIDLAGTVLESVSPDLSPGDKVIVTGWGLGERHWGGYAQRARLKSEWLEPLAAGLDLKQAMAIGTAGLTAMLCIMALEKHGLTPDKGEVAVTGASGGVGSVAVAILAHLGYQVVASTGRQESHKYLRELGAQDIIDRSVLATLSDRPLESGRWAGAVDSVGGETLASLLKSMAHRTSVAACGLAGGSHLPTTVHPFILRGVNLLGIDSNLSPLAERNEAWSRLARDLPLDILEKMTTVASLAEVPALSEAILKGKIRGRIAIDVNV
jgi:acrylyl-CoA reductase (NADPH)